MKALGAAVVAGLALTSVGSAQEPEPAPAPGLLTGPAEVVRHWSRNDYPSSVPEGVPYYIVVRGDTLWDISAQFLETPLLWPQVWDNNRYITDAHWIYPGDPILFPELQVLSDEAGLAESLPDDDAAARAAADAARAAEAERLIPATEPEAIMCSGYIVPGGEDRSLRIVGNENGQMLMEPGGEGRHKLALSDRDIIYLSKGANAGIQSGDRFTIHHVGAKVEHPANGGTLGTHIETVGAARVILVQENSSSAVIESSCFDVVEGDHLLPYRERPIPFLTRDAIGRADRLAPPSGRAQGHVVYVSQPYLSSAAGSFVQVDLGSADGVAPGSVLVAFREPIPGRDLPRNVIAELAVLTVQERTATAKIMYSRIEVDAGDSVEIK